MIYRINLFSPFIPNSVFKECVAGSRQKKVRKDRWIVVKLKETAFRIAYKDALGPLSAAFRIPVDQLLELLIKELDTRPRSLGILCEDCLFVHPDSFGKIMLSIGKRLR